MRRFVAFALLSALTCLGATWPVKTKRHWVEIDSPNFRVVSNAGANEARQAAYDFERARAIFSHLLSDPRLSPGRPLIIFAAKDDKTIREMWPGDSKGWKFVPPFLHVEGREKHYFLLRRNPIQGPYFTTAQDAFAEQVRGRAVFQSYSRLFTLANYGILPFWLETGLENFYGNTSLKGATAQVGTLGTERLWMEQHAVLPMDTLLTTDRGSPLLDDPEKATTFFVQALALVHYMVFAGSASQPKPLNEVVLRLHGGDDAREVIRDFLGDFHSLEIKLKSYVQNEWTKSFHLPLPPQVQLKDVPARELSEFEVLTFLGDFCLQGGWQNEARQYFNDALEARPQSDLAMAGLGWIDHLQGHHDEARDRLRRAVELNPNSYLAQYYLAVAQSRDTADAKVLDASIKGLLQAIQLEPSFAPAFDALANLMVKGGLNLDQAYVFSRKAIELERGAPEYYVTMAQVLLRANRPDLAIVPAMLALTAARTSELRATAKDLLENAAKARAQMGPTAPIPTRESFADAAPWRPQLKRRATAKKSVEDPSEQINPKPAPVTGSISSVSCRGFAMDLRIKSGATQWALHSSNLVALTYLPEEKRPATFDPCRKLNGARARVTFVPANEKGNDGEITTIEVLK